MDDYMNYNTFYTPSIPGSDMYPTPPIGMEDPLGIQQKANEPPPPPPIIICPTEVDHINVTLEKNQQCECKDCGKLFNSVWYLKQHAVKHSNDRPFKCKFCFKTYKFRSNLYQHKCPERQKSVAQRRRGNMVNSAKRNETQTIKTSKIETAIMQEEAPLNFAMPMPNCFSEAEDNDAPITYGLVIQNIDQTQMQQQMPPPQMSGPLQQQQQMPLQSQDMQQAPIMQNFQTFPMGLPPVADPMMNEMENTFDQKPDFESVRGLKLDPQQIEEYVEKNKMKLFSCHKCRLYFSTQEHFMRHSAAHIGEDLFPYKCTHCRQVFDQEKELTKHTLTHTVDGGIFSCCGCYGEFRSQVALRRHKDQCRPCFIPSNQPNVNIPPAAPFETYSSIDDGLFLPLCDDLARGTDSGVGSEGSPNSMSQASPERHGMDDSFSYISKPKKEKEDDEDSGFRSRLNSVTHSCSPDSFSDSHCDSPPRKLSGGGLGASSFLGGYGTGPAYGQQMIYDKSLDDIECDSYGMIKDTPVMMKAESFNLRSEEVCGREIAVMPLVQYHIQPMSMKEFRITTNQPSTSDNPENFDYDNRSWKMSGYDHPPLESSDMKELIATMMTLYLCTATDRCADMLATLAALSIN